MPVPALLLAALVVSQSPTPTEPAATAPGTVAERIAKGEAAMKNLDYDIAADELMRAATDPAATDEERFQAHLLAGIANRVLGKDVDAHTNFKYVLLHKPETQLPPDTGPKVLTFFESVRQELAAERAETAKNPAPVAAQPPPPEGPPLLATLGVGTIAVGALVGVAGGAVLTFAELSLADPTKPGEERAGLQTAGRAGLVAAGIGLVAAGAGAAMLIFAE